MLLDTRALILEWRGYFLCSVKIHPETGALNLAGSPAQKANVTLILSIRKEIFHGHTDRFDRNRTFKQ